MKVGELLVKVVGGSVFVETLELSISFSVPGEAVAFVSDWITAHATSTAK